MLLRYHPERFKITRPFAKQVVQYFRSNVKDGLVTQRNLTDIGVILERSYKSMISRLPFDKRPKNAKFLYKDLSYAMHYGTFNSLGKYIYHFDNELTDQFKMTDIDNVPIALLSFPHRSFYLSFGQQIDLNLWGDGFFVDGAYITAIPGQQLQIILSTIRNDIDYTDDLNWITNPDRYYYMSLNIDNPEDILSSVVDKSIEVDIQHIKDMSDAITDMTGVQRVEGKEAYVIDKRKRSSETEITERRTGNIVFKEALRLVINGLLYITAHAEEVEARWSDNTPRNMIERLEKATDKRSEQKAISDLLSQGYSKVNYFRTK